MNVAPTFPMIAQKLAHFDSYHVMPISLRQPHLSLGQFRRALKTHLFDCLQGIVTFLFLGADYK